MGAPRRAAMRRRCPRDGSLLDEKRVERVNVDVCPQCSGTFFDAIELRRVVGDARLALALAEEQGKTDAPLACPACAATMHLDHVEGIAIDHCPSCLGLWLDAGEVERLRARHADPVGETLHALGAR